MAVSLPVDEGLVKASELLLARIHPCLFLRKVHCVDNTTGDEFYFRFDPEDLVRFASTENPVTRTSIPEQIARKMLAADLDGYHKTGWEWQGDLIDWWVNEFITAVLKARQLGVTWCAAGTGLWYIAMVPGTRVLCQSIGEDEAADIIDHAWEMYLSLRDNHPHLVNHLKLVRPTNGRRPHMDIEFEHPNGRKSRFNAMPSTSAKGHGRTASFVIMDEFARHPYARESYKATVPTQAGSAKASGRTAIISTGNGVSTDEESGNFFHHLWTNRRFYGLQTKFLRWDTNPDRDESWYQRVAMKLPHRDRGEQYPNDEFEAFILTGDTFFDSADLMHYHENLLVPKYTFDWHRIDGSLQAKQRRGEFGSVSVFQPPVQGRTYAMGVDVSTGYGRDYSCGYVIDLVSQQIVCELHGRMDYDILGEQLHFTGRWYNDALIAVERGGGYGEAVIIALRDGKDGRPPYRRLYRHTQDATTKPARMSPMYGLPMAKTTRNLVITQLEKAIRERVFSGVPAGLLDECRTFVYRKTSPSPAAQDGCNDDRVMAAGITLEMYRRFGSHPEAKTKRKRDYTPAYPWAA